MSRSTDYFSAGSIGRPPVQRLDIVVGVAGQWIGPVRAVWLSSAGLAFQRRSGLTANPRSPGAVGVTAPRATRFGFATVPVRTAYTACEAPQPIRGDSQIANTNRSSQPIQTVLVTSTSAERASAFPSNFFTPVIPSSNDIYDHIDRHFGTHECPNLPPH